MDKDKGVASFYDRYENTLTRHADLTTLAHPDNRSEDLRKELEMFFRGFMSRNRCDTKKDAWEALICSCDADGGQADDVVRAIIALDLSRGL